MSQIETHKLGKNKYLFISYSHKNKDELLSFISFLDSVGINYWYDDDLKIGERWNNRVQKNISSEQCVGSILFVSEEWACSDACRLETDYIKSHHENVYIVSAKGDIGSKAKMFLQDNFNFEDTVIYAKNSLEDAKKLGKTFIKDNIDVINNYEVITRDLLKKKLAFQEGDFVYLNLGEYPINKIEEIYRPYSDEIFMDDFDVKKYLQIPGKNHACEFEKVPWRIIDVNGQEMVLINKFSLISSSGRMDVLQEEIKKFKARSKLNDYQIDILDQDTLDLYQDEIQKQLIIESKFVLEHPRHTPNMFFIKEGENIKILNQFYQNLGGGIISPAYCVGSPILLLRIPMEKEIEL